MQMQRWSTGYRASPPAQPSEYEPDHDGGKRDHGPVPQTVNWSTRQRLMRVRIDLHAYTGLTTANRSGRSDCPQLPMPRLGRTESAHSGRAPSGGSLSLCCHSGCRRASPGLWCRAVQQSATDVRQLPPRVKSAVLTIVRSLPVCPQFQTSRCTTLTVAMGQKQRVDQLICGVGTVRLSDYIACANTSLSDDMLAAASPIAW